jgi:hypothetical protein
MFFKSKFVSFAFISSFILISGCIRLTGKAGYYKQTPEETETRVVGFDTAKILENKQTRGSIAT